MDFFQNFDLLYDLDDHAEAESQLLSITKEQYENLIQLVPEVERLKKIIDKMSHIIKSKDSKLKEQQKILERDEKMNMNLSKLSTVNIRPLYFIHTFTSPQLRFAFFMDYI